MHTPQQTERQALDAANNRTTRRRPRVASTALPYPYLPDDSAPCVLFWLAAWLRHQKQVEELKAHVRRRAWSTYSLPLGHAFCQAESAAEKQAAQALDHLAAAQ